jgi:hypothetical protein
MLDARLFERIVFIKRQGGRITAASIYDAAKRRLVHG